MARVSISAVLGLFLLATPAAAQMSVYAGAMGTANKLYPSSTSLDPLSTFVAAGGLVGLRLHDAWSIELHLDRGFGASPERERLEIYGRSTIQDRVGRGFSVLGVWKTPLRARVGAAALLGSPRGRLRRTP